MKAAHYKGFTITARTFQVRGSGRWTLDLLIGQRDVLRAFSGSATYGTEAAAETGCLVFAQHIIDNSRLGCALADLTMDPAPGRGPSLQARGSRDIHH
jgi:hypothetical protein